MISIKSRSFLVEPIATTTTAIFSDGERTYSLSVVKADFITAL